MEGSHWFRLGVIATLFIGSFYVLLPTLLQVDPTGGLQKQADEVQRKDERTIKERREFRLDVREGDAAELAEALEARLTAAALSIEGVVVDDGQVVVRRELQVKDDDILAFLEPAPVIDLHALGVELPADAPTDAAGLATLDVVSALAGTSATTAASDLALAKVAGSVATFVVAPPPETGPLTVVVDGAVRGIVVPDPPDEADPEAPAPDTGTYAPLGGYADLARDLAIVDLPGRLVPTGPAVIDVIDTDIPVDDGASSLPDWLLSIIPDTRMPLGLDLQGGIDLTIQIELDEARLSQANRDLTYLEERATEKGLTITQARRNKYEAILEVQTPDGADALQAFFGESLAQQYEYLDQITDDDGTWERFYMTAERGREIEEQAVKQVLDVLRRRVAETKVRDPVVVQKGGGRISVQLPGFSDTKTAVSAIGKTAVLEFRLVDPKFRQAEVRRLLREAELALPEEVYNDDQAVNEWLQDNDLLPEDRRILFEYATQRDEETEEITRSRSFAYPVEAAAVLTGQDVNGADIGFDPQTQQPNVNLEFKPGGASIFCEFTGLHVNDQFAIILDGEVQSAPNINERICGGRARITMGSTVGAQDEAKALAVVLRTGSLNAPVSIGSVRQIGPTLGHDAIRAGSVATVLGGLIVLVFMALWYRLSGMIANIALVLNVMLMLAGLSLFGWTLTLPGIAGIALTIGMAVDANIIIYERIREELRMGQAARKAVETGFQKAAVAVIDANVTTAIAGVVLFSYGNVTIQGFAVTLLMGIATTLITALFVTRSLLEIVTRRGTARLKI